MKASIKANAANSVTIKYQCATTGDMIELDIYAPAHGGYVRYGGGQQLCKNLSNRGLTLKWSGDYPLVDLIRAEYKSMRQNEMRAA